jgi:hypothetical protein
VGEGGKILLHGAKTSFETRQEGLREGSSLTSAASTHTYGSLNNKVS